MRILLAGAFGLQTETISLAKRKLSDGVPSLGDWYLWRHQPMGGDHLVTASTLPLHASFLFPRFLSARQ